MARRNWHRRSYISRFLNFVSRHNKWNILRRIASTINFIKLAYGYIARINWRTIKGHYIAIPIIIKREFLLDNCWSERVLKCHYIFTRSSEWQVREVSTCCNPLSSASHTNETFFSRSRRLLISLGLYTGISLVIVKREFLLLHFSKYRSLKIFASLKHRILHRIQISSDPFDNRMLKFFILLKIFKCVAYLDRTKKRNA